MENLDKNVFDVYDAWNNEKKILANQRERKNYFQKGEIWWCYIGQNLGSESSGKSPNFTRPILIIKKLNLDTCICVLLTTKQKEGNWYVPILFQNINQIVVLSQIKMIHSRRLQRRIGSLQPSVFSIIKEKLRDLLELS
jgi:mRNA-degrading endonuclease toxin of MazEF toxin-antitoxin module